MPVVSKWIDEEQDWQIEDYLNTDQHVLLGFLWDKFKERAEELQAFAERQHSEAFEPDNLFPDYDRDDHELVQSHESGIGPNDMEKINKGIYPTACLKTDDIQSSGEVSETSPADQYTLSELLTDKFLYASGEVRHMLDTEDGTKRALPSLSWMKQWFQVMNYPEYYLKPGKNGSFDNDIYEAVEVQEIKIETSYNHDISPFAFNLAKCEVTVRTSGAVPPTVDVYQGGDLNETALNMQQVRDYTIAKIDDYKNTWWSFINHDLGTKPSFVLLSENYRTHNFNGGDPENEFRVSVRLVRVRFKLHKEYRALDPEQYEPPVFWNGYNTGGSEPRHSAVGGVPPVISDYNDFGTGIPNNECQLHQLTKDPDGWYYLEIENADFDTEPFLPFIPLVEVPLGSSQSITQSFSLQKMNLQAGTELTPPFKTTTGGIGGGSLLNQKGSGVYVAPNQADGSAFEFFTS